MSVSFFVFYVLCIKDSKKIGIIYFIFENKPFLARKKTRLSKYCEAMQGIALPQALLISVAIKTRAEQTRLLCRGVATKRNEVHLKAGFSGLYI